MERERLVLLPQITVPLDGKLVFKVFREFTVATAVTLMDEHSCKVEFGSCQLDNRLLVLIMELAIIGSGNNYEILKPLNS